MSLYQNELDRLHAEFGRRCQGLAAAAGLIAEAEELENALKNSGTGSYGVVPVVTSYPDRGDCYVRIYVWANHAEFLVGLGRIGAHIVSSEALESRDGKLRRRVMLSGFDVPVEIEGEMPSRAAA